MLLLFSKLEDANTIFALPSSGEGRDGSDFAAVLLGDAFEADHGCGRGLRVSEAILMPKVEREGKGCGWGWGYKQKWPPVRAAIFDRIDFREPASAQHGVARRGLNAGQ